MKKYLTLENALKFTQMIVGAAHVLTDGAPDRIKDKVRELLDAAKKDYPADAPITWAAIEAQCDALVARGKVIDVMIDAEPA